MPTKYGQVYSQMRGLSGGREKVLLGCVYRNNSLGVVRETKYPNNGEEILFTNRYRIVLLGDNKYTGLALDYIYPKSQKLAKQLADELDDPNWLIYDELSQDDKNALYQKLKKVAGM